MDQLTTILLPGNKENTSGKIFAEVFNKTSQPFILTDAEMKIMHYNSAASSSVKKIFSKKLSDGIPLNEPLRFEDFFRENLDKCKEAGYSNFQITYTAHGQNTYINFQFVNTGSGLFLLNWSDVTETNKKITDLSNNLAEKEKIFSLIAHDLINPLTGVIGFSELLSREFSRDNLDSDGIPKIRDWNIERLKKITERIDIINNSTKEVYSLLENLLDWSRSRSSDLKPWLERINIHESIESVISFSKSQADFKKITIENLTDSALFAVADRNMFKTIIRNFLSNAIKFTPRNGNIEISSSLTSKSRAVKHGSNAKAGETYIRIDVSDTGVGIPDKVLGELLTPGFNAPTKGTESERGTGIGLKVSREFAEKMEGNISVKSKRGKGSIFSVTLPA
ncbi:MAG: HAMP domain-containing histidine kinase [Ignavibacteria bacterium]|nr:HAMP domain-containing histidine kinase [Ignavibacteria bacterium]